MAQGLVLTLELSLICSLASIAVGVVLGIMIVTTNRMITRAVRTYIELWRGLPPIVILFFVFFALPAVGLLLSPAQAAGVGLCLWGSAVAADNVRGAISSISKGQSEAAAALGLGWSATMALVILPQAMRRLIPPTLNLLTSLIHATSLAAQLGALELLEASRRSIQRLLLDVGNSHAIAIFGAVLVVYFVICYPIILLSRRLERIYNP
jgi:polar amino acid transport system permease protein